MDLARKFVSAIHYVRVICYFIAATLLACIGMLIMANCASSRFPYVNANVHGYRTQISVIGLIVTFSGLAIFGKTLAHMKASSFVATSPMFNITSESLTIKLHGRPDVASTHSPGEVTLTVPNSNVPFAAAKKNGFDVCLTTIGTPPPKYEDVTLAGVRCNKKREKVCLKVTRYRQCPWRDYFQDLAHYCDIVIIASCLLSPILSGFGLVFTIVTYKTDAFRKPNGDKLIEAWLIGPLFAVGGAIAFYVAIRRICQKTACTHSSSSEQYNEARTVALMISREHERRAPLALAMTRNESSLLHHSETPPPTYDEVVRNGKVLPHCESEV